MLTKTSETAVQALVCLALHGNEEPIPPRKIAEKLGASPSYMAKICGVLVKANILRAARGVKGGVTLTRPTAEIRLLDVVEACEGVILGNYCEGCNDLQKVCAYHRAMIELHQATLQVLGRWTIADLAARPEPAPSLRGKIECLMSAATPVSCTGKNRSKAKAAATRRRP